MKWVNKCHEYDGLFESMNEKSSFYLFGAGDRGKQYVTFFENLVPIVGFLDNNPSLKGKRVLGYPCMYPLEVEYTDDIGIIICADQFVRGSMVEQLESLGLKKNIDFFFMDEFVSVYNVYKYNKVVFTTISFLPSTACNLKCRHCLNFNPFTDKFYVRKLVDLKKDIDLFFSCVDFIMMFHLSGGEPFLYNDLSEIVSYIYKNYKDKIGSIRMVTNGTVIPKQEILDCLNECNVEVKVDDYREAVPSMKCKFEELMDALRKNNIQHYSFKVDSWIDLAPEKTDYSNKSEEWLISHRDDCNQAWLELRDGKLYSCNYAAYATVAGLVGEQDMEEVYELTSHNEQRKKELIEFRLGYTSKGYTNFCKKCRGFTSENTECVPVAEQIQGKILL